mmetsp:Transcript_88014/g.179789  ORF Transcript_88014/g.179789 Transcript_88014/m.179789 type:complete len:138 (-) Transcript_88014:538-951(-)
MMMLKSTPQGALSPRPASVQRRMQAVVRASADPALSGRPGARTRDPVGPMDGSSAAPSEPVSAPVVPSRPGGRGGRGLELGGGSGNNGTPSASGGDDGNGGFSGQTLGLVTVFFAVVGGAAAAYTNFVKEPKSAVAK